MGSDTKLTKTRRRMKAAKRAELRSKKANKHLAKLHAKGFNKPLSLHDKPPFRADFLLEASERRNFGDVKIVFFLFQAGQADSGTDSRRGAPSVPREIPDLSQLDEWLANREQQISGLKPGVEAGVLWAEKAGKQSPVSIVYLPGYTATRGELSPAVERIAQTLGANLFFCRPSGQGMGIEGHQNVTMNDWVEDGLEALEIGRRLGPESGRGGHQYRSHACLLADLGTGCVESGGNHSGVPKSHPQESRLGTAPLAGKGALAGAIRGQASHNAAPKRAPFPFLGFESQQPFADPHDAVGPLGPTVPFLPLADAGPGRF